MSISNDDDNNDPGRPASLVTLLAQAGFTKASVIRVTGPGALPALLWLCRHGYDQVGYIRAGQGAPHEDETDAVLVAHTCGELELKLFLSMSRRVRPGGLFIFRLRTHPGSSQMGLEWLLKRYGLTVAQRIESDRRALIVARRDGVVLQKAA